MCSGSGVEHREAVILVVDDEPIVLRVLEGVLSGHGYHVLAAPSASAAVELFRAAPRVDLLLADVVMPDVSGPELAETLHRLYPALPVLFTAGMPDSPMIRSRIVARGYPLIPKPFLPSELLAAVREVLAHALAHSA